MFACRLAQVVHFLWELLPLADFSTDFLASNHDVSILVPECALCITILETLWAPYVCGGRRHVHSAAGVEWLRPPLH